MCEPAEYNVRNVKKFVGFKHRLGHTALRIRGRSWLGATVYRRLKEIVDVLWAFIVSERTKKEFFLPLIPGFTWI